MSNLIMAIILFLNGLLVPLLGFIINTPFFVLGSIVICILSHWNGWNYYYKWKNQK
jgi:hypothetical protein